MPLADIRRVLATATTDDAIQQVIEHRRAFEAKAEQVRRSSHRVLAYLRKENESMPALKIGTGDWGSGTGKHRPSSRFSSPVAHDSAWRTALKIETGEQALGTGSCVPTTCKPCFHCWLCPIGH